MLIWIKGAGDIATGVAVRLRQAGFEVAMTELERPSAIRRTVAFSEALYNGWAEVEGICARPASCPEQGRELLSAGEIPIFTAADMVRAMRPTAMVDATIAKRNTGTAITDAGVVIGLGPGFTVGLDCHAAVETMRGHYLGRVYYEAGQSPMPNTGVPGLIAGAGAERVMYTPRAGRFHCLREIGDAVAAGEAVAEVEGSPVLSSIEGILRGLLPEGFMAPAGFKCADVDPRCRREHCFTCSDKARAIGGAALEALLKFGIFPGK